MAFMPLAEIGGTTPNKSQMTYLQDHPWITCIKCILGVHCGHTVVTIVQQTCEILSANLHICGIQEMGASSFRLCLAN